MELEVIRISSGTDSTNGVLFEIDKHSPAPHAEGFRCKRKFLAYTLEDEYRKEKNMAKQGYLMEYINWVLEKKVDIMQNILNVFLIFILACFTCLMFLVLSIYLFTVEILTNIPRVVFSSETPKKIIKSRRTVL